MNSTRRKQTVMPPLKALALSLALALAFGSGASLAGTASVNITGFTASAELYSGNYAWGVDAYQSYTMTAQNGGGLYGSSNDTFSDGNWNLGISRVASTTHAQATGNTVQFTDTSTQLTTAGFNLLAAATQSSEYPDPTPPNYGNATGLQSGAFTLIDGNGDAIAGTITFTVYYDLAVSSTLGALPSNYAQSQINLLGSDDGGENFSFADGLLSSNFAGGVGGSSGFFTWTVTLAAGDVAYYTLSGNAIASAANVPEPGRLAMVSLGLMAMAGLARWRRRLAITA
jgi:hypothetical protein